MKVSSLLVVLVLCLVVTAGCDPKRESGDAPKTGVAPASPAAGPTSNPAAATPTNPAATPTNPAATPTNPAATPTNPAAAPTSPATPANTAPTAPGGKTDAAAKPAAGTSGAPISAAIQPGTTPEGMVRTQSGLEYQVLKQGEGTSPPIGARVTVHFAGFVDGRKFMDTRQGGVPREFKLDRGHLIDGWVEALLTMKKGEQRKLKVPSRLAYGSQGYPGVVPPEKDVLFDLELVSFLPSPAGR